MFTHRDSTDLARVQNNEGTERETERASREEEYADLDEASADRTLDQQEGAGTDEVVDAAVFDEEALAPDDDAFEPVVPVQLPASLSPLSYSPY